MTVRRGCVLETESIGDTQVLSEAGALAQCRGRGGGAACGAGANPRERASETRGVCSRRRKQQTVRNATETRRGQKICFLAFTVIKERPTSARTATTSPQRRWDLRYRELEGGSGWSKGAPLLIGHSPRRAR